MHAEVVVVGLPATQPVARREAVEDISELARVAQVLALARAHVAVESLHALLGEDGGVVDESSARAQRAHGHAAGILRPHGPLRQDGPAVEAQLLPGDGPQLPVADDEVGLGQRLDRRVDFAGPG